MFDSNKVYLGIAPIGWCNDDMPELGAENTFRQTVSEMALAGFTGCEIGNKYPSDPKELKWELDLRGMRIASRWFSSFILTILCNVSYLLSLLLYDTISLTFISFGLFIITKSSIFKVGSILPDITIAIFIPKG